MTTVSSTGVTSTQLASLLQKLSSHHHKADSADTSSTVSADASSSSSSTSASSMPDGGAQIGADMLSLLFNLQGVSDTSSTTSDSASSVSSSSASAVDQLFASWEQQNGSSVSSSGFDPSMAGPPPMGPPPGMEASASSSSSSSSSASSGGTDSSSFASALNDIESDLQKLIDSLGGASSASSSASSTSSSASSSSSSDMFKSIDADGDGKITKAEWEKARPPGMSVAMADQLFSKIDTASTGSISASQLQDAFDNGTLGGAQPSAQTAFTDTSSTATSSTASASTSTGSGVDLAALLQALQSYMDSANQTASRMSVTSLSSIV